MLPLLNVRDMPRNSFFLTFRLSNLCLEFRSFEAQMTIISSNINTSVVFHGNVVNFF